MSPLVLVLFALQFAAALAGGAWLWRRLARQEREIAALRQTLEALSAVGAQRQRRRVQVGATVVDIQQTARAVPAASIVREAPMSRAARAWRVTADALPAIQPATWRGAGLGVAALLPAIASLFNLDRHLVVASGLMVAGAMMLLALRAPWRVAAWASVGCAAAWSLLGLFLHVADAQPLVVCVALAGCGAAGLVHAYRRDMRPGAALVAIAGAGALTLGAQQGMIGAPGVAFGLLTGLTAIVGALSLRLESLHAGAFVAALAGLFVLSGQHDAAIWFTPAASWAGALFFAIAVVATPRLGARGVALAGVGAIAPLLAIAALYASNQGLADPRAAGGALAVLALLLSAVLALGAERNGRGLAALKLTLWVLASGAFVAFAAGVELALPAPFAAPLFAALALGLVALDQRWAHAAWRAFASLAIGLSVWAAFASIQLLLGEAGTWNAWAVIGAGLTLPAGLLAGVVLLSKPNAQSFTAATGKIASIALGALSADMIVRVVFSGGALMLQPVGFVEAGFHITAWLAIALLVAARRGANADDQAAALVLGAVGLGASAVSALAWLTPYWDGLIPARGPALLLQFDGLGFAGPAILFWAHWVFWRARGSHTRTRVALGAASALSACFVSLEVLRPHGPPPDTISALIAAFSFVLAGAINFAPGVVAKARSHLQEDFHRDGRGQ